MNKPKLIRITTVPSSLSILLKGQMKYMSNNGFNVIAVSSQDKELKDVEVGEGIKVFPVNMTRTISPIKDLKSLWELYLLLKKEKPDIVHTHSPKAGTLGMMAAWLAKVPVRIHTIAGLPLLEAKGLKRKLLNLVEKLTYSFATMIYPNSYALREIILQNNYTHPDKLKVIGNGSSNGINTSVFDPKLFSDDDRVKLRNKLGIKQEDYVFLFVGRVVTDKGVNELVKVFNDLYNKMPLNEKPHLVIVGEGEPDLDPLLPEIQKTIETNPNIHSVGFKFDVRPYFVIADLFVFPSYREGFPNVVMQTAAMQLNAVVSDINGCNEIISDGDNGWIVPPKNMEELKKLMKWCMENREESKNMGIVGREQIKQKYEKEYVWHEILKEYNYLLSRNIN